MTWNWPWAPRPDGATTAAETKQAGPIGFVALHMQNEANWTRRDYGALAREGFMRNPVVHRCVRLIAETAAAVPWLLYEGAAEHGEHPLMELIDRPNPRQAGGAFFEALYGHLLLSGNAYVELVEAGTDGRELHLLRPDRVAVVSDEAGWPVALDYRHDGSKRRVPLGRPGAGAAQFSLFHPLDDHYGFPPLQAALMALDTHNAAGRWNKALLDNSARPSGALVYAPKDGANLTEEQFERLKAELEQGYGGPTRAGRPLLLEGGLDWKAMGLSPKDMDFMQAKNGAARDVALAFGVPPMLLGIPGDNTYANYAEANRAFYRLTVLPLVGRIAKDLSAFLGPAFGRGLRFWYDADRIEGLSGERDALWARVDAASFLGDDEKREAVGYPPRGGLAAKAGFRPDQPRVPKGNPDGGQWTDEGSGARVIPVQARPPGGRGGPRRVGGRWRNVPPAQATQLAISNSRMRAAVQRVRELDPRWKPRPSAYETVEGEIAANRAAMREAEARLLELQRMGIGPGPYAKESLPARSSGRNWTAEEIREINRIGRKYGCHTCGTKDPGTPSGNFFLDHQLSSALNPPGRSQRIFPHCIACSGRQGAWVTNHRRRR